MYHRIKKLLKRFFPGVVHHFEFQLRGLLVLLYRGNKVICNVCDRKLKHFILLQNGDKLCPGCGSLGRHRRLWTIIQEYILPNKDQVILHFSPSKIIQKKLKPVCPHYITSDFDGKLHTDFAYDITNIDVPDNTFNVVICYHVLEHIIDDRKAMSEMNRIMKNNGLLIVQTPFKEGEIFEDFSIIKKEDRKTHFGQEDHVRIYSVSGLKERLEQASFSVQLLRYTEAKNNTYGYKETESVLMCTNLQKELKFTQTK